MTLGGVPTLTARPDVRRLCERAVRGGRFDSYGTSRVNAIWLLNETL